MSYSTHSSPSPSVPSTQEARLQAPYQPQGYPDASKSYISYQPYQPYQPPVQSPVAEPENTNTNDICGLIGPIFVIILGMALLVFGAIYFKTPPGYRVVYY